MRCKGTISVPMKREFTAGELQAEILWYLWGKGAWSEIYTNQDKMVSRLSKVVTNNGSNILNQLDTLMKARLVLSRKKGDTISLNPYYKQTIRKCINDNLGLDL